MNRFDRWTLVILSLAVCCSGVSNLIQSRKIDRLEKRLEAPQIPVVPPGISAEERTYVVQEGDTLWGLAERFYGDGALWTRLVEVNGVRDPGFLRVGQVLEIP